MSRGYKPTDEEAYDLLLRAGNWARRFRRNNGERLTKELIREWLCLGTPRWNPEIEHRIFQESGRLGAFEAKRQKKSKQDRERREKDNKRQIPFDFKAQ